MKYSYSLPIVALLLLPFILYAESKSGNTTPSTSHYLTFLSMAIIFAGVAIRGSIWVRLFLVYVGLHCVGGMVIGYPVGKEYFKENVFLMAGSLYFLAVVNSEGGWRPWAWGLCILALIHCILSWAQIMGTGLEAFLYPKYRMPESLIPSSFFANPGYLANNLAIAAPMCLFLPGGWKWAIVPVGYTIMVTGALGGCLAFFVGIGTWWWLQDNRKWVRVGLILTAIAAAAVYNFTLNDKPSFFTNVRWSIWWETVKVAWSHGLFPFIFGHGTGSAYTSHSERLTHNDFLFVWYKYGLVGMSLIAGYITAVIRRVRHTRLWLPCFLSALTAMMSSNVIQFVPSAMLLLAVIGVMEKNNNG